MKRLWMVRWLLALLVGIAFACACAPAARPSATLPATTLRVGTSGNYPPLSLWKGDRPEGFAPALLDGFASTARLDLAWTRFRWPELTTDLRAGRFDLAADGITVRPERSVAGRFTVPIARGAAVLLLRRPSWAPKRASGERPIAAVRALDRAELRVVVNRGGHLERVARHLLPASSVRAIADNGAVREAFARGEADAAMTNTFEAPRWAEGLADIEALGPLSKDVTALWVRADRTDIAERLDTWLLDEEESGRLDALRTRALGPDAGGATALPVDALLAATAERLSLMPFVAAAKRASTKAVEDTAQEDRVLAAGVEAVAKAAAAKKAPAPPRELVHAFFRAQIEAAKSVQQRAPPGTATAQFSLETELRPAIARITARMALLIVRVPAGTTRAAVIARALEDLEETGLDTDGMDRIASAIAAFGDR